MGIDLFDALGLNISAPDSAVLAVHIQQQLYHVAAKFTELFQAQPGKVSKNFKHKPDIDTLVPPVLEPLLRVALSYQDKVPCGLNAMEEDVSVRRLILRHGYQIWSLLPYPMMRFAYVEIFAIPTKQSFQIAIHYQQWMS